MAEVQESPIPEIGQSLKVIIGSVGTSFLLGMVFWAGATYNRILAIEAHLTSIDAAVAKIGDIQTLQVKQDEIERRIQRTEDEVRATRVIK